MKVSEILEKLNQIKFTLNQLPLGAEIEKLNLYLSKSNYTCDFSYQNDFQQAIMVIIENDVVSNIAIVG